MIFLQSLRQAVCLAALVTTVSCSNESDVNPVTTATDDSIEKATGLTSKTYVAPSSSSAFSSALVKCKLQSDYLSADVTDLSAYASYFFYLSSGKMVLYNNGGSSTRTELRRTDNFDKTSTRKMTISANLVSQPSGEVTIAQLHNQNAALPVLRISVSGNTLYYKVNKEPVKGTSLTNNGAFTTTLPSSKLLEITLELTGNKYISATVNGEKRTFKIEDAWGTSYNNAYYFKTGVYCQSEGTAKLTYNSLTWE
ncbi:polysaccharide lyase family 7 protein [Flavobacterium sp. UMI-01]|uniref:polysaccharide lyase family 7 protein n=1 Tax=Flavobacterium sp. UMI-01 TaxID=1441053 RepID=UPI001C7CD222|nr:polysaccharide lyase family 7 protein [Flavobacterium sp. UMI-01]